MHISSKNPDGFLDGDAQNQCVKLMNEYQININYDNTAINILHY
jgi:hypothetical protein